MPGKKKSKWNPREYISVEELQEKCDAYFEQCRGDGVLAGEAGLALALDISLATLRSWYDGKTRSEFQESIRRAYLRIQSQLESDEIYMQKGMVTKSIFLLKQPRLGGYQDKVEANQDINVKVTMGENMNESDFQ